jgi:hypothetical protein
VSSKKKKNSALAAAATRRLEKLGPAPVKMSPEQITHALMHAEERGEVQRVTLEDGSWAWVMQGPDGKPQVLKPTPEMLAALHRFETEGHPSHDE